MDNGSHDADIEPGVRELDSLSPESKERLSAPDDSSEKRRDSESVICTAGTSLKPDPQENGADHNDCEVDDEGERIVDREKRDKSDIKTENGKQDEVEDEETDDAREESKERERMKEYLKRSDRTAVIFPESVSVFGLKDCLTNDQEQDEACRKKRNDLKNSSKVAGSVSEYLIFSCQFSRSQVVVHSVLFLFCDADALLSVRESVNPLSLLLSFFLLSILEPLVSCLSSFCFALVLLPSSSSSPESGTA